MHEHVKIDIDVLDNFIQKFAEKYLDQRSQTQFDYSAINEHVLYDNLGFSTDALKQIISRKFTKIIIRKDTKKIRE